jgi:hypothetical protein
MKKITNEENNKFIIKNEIIDLLQNNKIEDIYKDVTKFKVQINKDVEKIQFNFRRHLNCNHIINTPLYSYNKTKERIAFERYIQLNFPKEGLHHECLELFLIYTRYFNNSIIFRPEDIIMDLLLKTDIKDNILIKLPFDEIFIDYAFEYKNIKIDGIFLTNCNFGNKKNNTTRILISYMGVDMSDTTPIYGYKTINSIDSEMEGVEPVEIIDRENIPILDILSNLVVKIGKNFIHFLNSNNHDIKIIKQNKERNKIRKKKGKSEIPTIRYIKLNNEVKKYYEKMEYSEKSLLSYRFWVRGHFRNYKKKIIWIKPYIKGKGILVNKSYIVN